MAEPGYFTALYYAAIPSDSGQDRGVQARVRVTMKVKSGDVLQALDRDPVTAIPILPTLGVIEDGVLKPAKGEPPGLRLLANVGLGLTGDLFYSIEFLAPKVDGVPVTMDAFDFAAPTVEEFELDLSSVAPAVGQYPSYAVIGPSVDSLLDATAVGKAVVRAADQAAARTAIGAVDQAAVTAAVDAVIAGAPGALDTLNELAAALGDDANFAATVTAALAGKQASDTDLTAIAALVPVDNDILQRKSGAWTNRTPAQVKTDLALTKGDVGLGNVDNTSDAAKPISTATQTALDAKADEVRTITAGTGLTGGGDLTADRTLALDAASQASLGLADTAIQSGAGGGVTATATGRALVTAADAAAARTAAGAADAANVALLNAFFFDPLAPEFGAVGDGVTDDTTAVQAAVTAAKAVKGYVVLRRMFLVNQTIVQNDGFGIVGVGHNAGFKAGSSFPTDAPILHTTKDGTTSTLIEGHVYGCSVRNIRIDGNARSVNCIGWQLDLATNLDIYKVDIRNVKGYGLFANNSVRETDFYHVHLRACGDASRDMAGVAISQNASNDAHNNLHFYGLYSVASYGVALDVGATDDTSPVRNIQFYSPMLHGNYGAWQNDDLAVTLDWEHLATPVVRIRDARQVAFYSPRLHLSGNGQPLILIGNNPNTLTTENSVTISDGSYGTSRDVSQTFTVDAATNECDSVGVKLGEGALVRFTTTGTLPAPLTGDTDYYAIRVDDDTFKVATSRDNAEVGTAIDLTDTGSGTHTVTAQSMSVLVEQSTTCDVVIDGGRTDGAVPNRAAVINKNGDGNVTIRQFSPRNTLTVYERFSTTDYGEQTTTVVKAVKTADTSKASDVDNTVSDPHLQLALYPGTWAIRGWILYEASTTGDLKIRWSSSQSGWTGEVRFAGQATSATVNVGSQFNLASSRGVSTARGGIGATKIAFQFDGYVTVDVAGTFLIQWAQQTSDPTPTIVYAGSYVVAEFLA